MNTQELLQFLGHSSIFDPFEDFLMKNGIIRRPKLADSYPYSIDTKTTGLSLIFEDAPEDKGQQRKSAGSFIFCQVYFDFESKSKPFVGDLPYGIGQERDSKAIERQVGAPSVKRDSKQTSGFTISFYIDGLVFTAAYSDKDGRKLRFVRVSLKDKYHVTHGLAPA